MNKSLLVIEDDPSIRGFLKDLLLDNGYAVNVVSRGTEGLRSIDQTRPDLVILDLGLPDISGESVCLEIRKKYPHLRVIILSAKHNIVDVINGLQLGADDYITKPFVADEFLARINARLRYSNEENSVIKIDDLTLNLNTHDVIRNDIAIELTAQEFKLLNYMMMNKGRVLTRDMILNRLWVSSPEVETRVVDVYIGYLRKKIDLGFSKKLIRSIRGFGYMLKE
ncbi:MAG: response regulator transcription factor [bacterium]|nr:response regulator transcription factor [bacterium]